jgi:hypothetical protein
MSSRRSSGRTVRSTGRRSDEIRHACRAGHSVPRFLDLALPWRQNDRRVLNTARGVPLTQDCVGASPEVWAATSLQELRARRSGAAATRGS